MNIFVGKRRPIEEPKAEPGPVVVIATKENLPDIRSDELGGYALEDILLSRRIEQERREAMGKRSERYHGLPDWRAIEQRVMGPALAMLAELRKRQMEAEQAEQDRLNVVNEETRRRPLISR